MSLYKAPGFPPGPADRQHLTYYSITAFNTTSEYQPAESDETLLSALYGNMDTQNIEVAIARFRVPTDNIEINSRNIPYDGGIEPPPYPEVYNPPEQTWLVAVSDMSRDNDGPPPTTSVIPVLPIGYFQPEQPPLPPMQPTFTYAIVQTDQGSSHGTLSSRLVQGPAIKYDNKQTQRWVETQTIFDTSAMAFPTIAVGPNGTTNTILVVYDQGGSMIHIWRYPDNYDLTGVPPTLVFNISDIKGPTQNQICGCCIGEYNGDPELFLQTKDKSGGNYTHDSFVWSFSIASMKDFPTLTVTNWANNLPYVGNIMNNSMNWITGHAIATTYYNGTGPGAYPYIPALYDMTTPGTGTTFGLSSQSNSPDQWAAAYGVKLVSSTQYNVYCSTFNPQRYNPPASAVTGYDWFRASELNEVWTAEITSSGFGNFTVLVTGPAQGALYQPYTNTANLAMIMGNTVYDAELPNGYGRSLPLWIYGTSTSSTTILTSFVTLPDWQPPQPPVPPPIWTQTPIRYMQQYCEQVNTALFNSFADRYAPHVETTTEPPIMMFDADTKLFSFICTAQYGTRAVQTSVTTIPMTIWISASFLETFHFPVSISHPQIVNGVTMYRIAPSNPNQLTGAPFKIQQERCTVGQLTDFCRVLVMSRSFSVSGNIEGSNTSVKCLTDVVPDVDTITPGAALLYLPPFYRWYGVFAGSPLNRMDVAITYQTRDSRLHRIMVSPGDFWSVLLVFRRHS